MTDQNMLRDIFGQHTQVRDVRIIKGNTQGQFDRFCYAFITIKASEEHAQSIINKVSIDHPNWKMNIKQDNQTQKMNMNNPPFQMRQPPNRNFNQMYMPPDMGMMMRQQPYTNQNYMTNNSYQTSSNQNTSEKILGEKIYKIFVREIWLGGIPQMCDQNYMATLMSQFGIVDNMQIFPKFAFVRFKMAQQATNAYQRASRIYNMFGQPSGFRITFSDPSRRAQIVSNHYDYDRMSVFIPVLFLGFPPVTSATVQLDHMRSICQKYGTIVNYFMKKNNNNQTRSYILFTYDNLKSALRAKQELSRRRDLLGDKRVQVTLLLNQNQLMKGRDLSQTQRLFPDPISTTTKTINYDKSKKNPTLMFPNQQMMYQQQPMNYQQNYQSGYIQPSYPGMYYPQSYDKKVEQLQEKGNQWMPPEWQKYDKKREGQWDRPIQSMQPPRQHYQGKYYPKNQQHDVFNLVQQVLEKGSSSPVIDQPKIKKPVNNQYTDASQIISKILGTSQRRPDQGYNLYQQRREEIQGNIGDKEKNPAWSGILTWKGTKRANIDGHFQIPTDQECEFQDYNVNLFYTASPSDIVLKQKLFKLILEPMNSISGQAFQQYLALLKGKVGISVTRQCPYIIYVMGKSKQSDQICKIEQNQLLMVMQRKLDVYPLIKDKLNLI